MGKQLPNKQQQIMKMKICPFNMDPIEKERKRQREKYHRFKDRYKEICGRTSRSLGSKYKNQARDLKLEKGMCAHHWDYSKLGDVIIMPLNLHKKLHSLMIRDGDVFKDKKTGDVLSKEDQESLILTLKQI